jgi:hypothetical protein
MPKIITKSYVRMVVGGVIFFVFALTLNYFAGSYATNNQSNTVNDLFLDILPLLDVSLIFVYGSLLYWAIIVCILVQRIKEIPFFLKAFAMFSMMRSAFIVLTHLGPYPHPPITDPFSLLKSFTFGGDLFFSGHTGAPFLMALLYWRVPALRRFSLITSIVFGITVLLGHLHYSIDVFAAFFITYGVYHMAIYFFPEEYALFSESISERLAR